ncbi:hypothetical protein [Arthrobacter celericrescens]|uniref:hypothetical protein n=1 Tax=Arthrobacter celericrescens TaxID=2320851 RepID=UPI0013C4C36C|nr:hypothetical protein [Arthrobacter celericrescens]
MTFDAGDWVAVGAAIISLAAIFIAIQIHRDSGGRIKVRMNLAAYTSSNGVLAVAQRGAYALNPRWPALPAVELAQIILENPGRTPVTVTNIELRLEGVEQQRYAVRPQLFTLGKNLNAAPAGGSTPSISGSTRVRIAPFDHTTVLFDYLSVVDMVFKEDPSLHEFNLVAEATVAGHEHPATSKRSGYWRIRRHLPSGIEPRVIRRTRDVVLLELVRGLTQDLSETGYLHEIAQDFEKTLPMSTDEIYALLAGYINEESEALFPSNAASRLGSISVRILQRLQFLGDRVTPRPEGKVNRATQDDTDPD